MRMAVLSRRLTMSGPSCMCNAGVGVKDLCHIDARAIDEFFELGNLAHLLESKNLISLVTVDS